MKSTIIKLSDIANHPTKRLDAEYWITKEFLLSEFKNKKAGIVLKDIEEKYTLIAYSTTTIEFNKALIYKSIPPIRQANEIITKFDNKDYEILDETKLDEYLSFDNLVIINEKEIVFGKNKKS